MKKSAVALVMLGFLSCLPGPKAAAQQLRPVVLSKPDSAATFRFLPPVLPANYATQRYGFFCRQELKLDKVTPIPLRFRLGSVEETDRMEGKRRQ